jgi:DNA replication protein DnaC
MIDVDAAKLPLMLTTLRLPTISRIWQEFGGRADREGWGSARFLAALCEHELADRQARRIARHMAESGLPQGKSFATFDFAAVPTIRKAHVMALAEGDAWLEQGANILIWPQRNRQVASRGGARHGARRHRPARPLHPHHRSRAETAGGAA